MAAAMAEITSFELPGFEATTQADQVERFALSIGEPPAAAGETRPIPFTFPLRWLADMGIRHAVYDLVDNEDGTFFVIIQNVEYFSTLELDQTYTVTVTGERRPGDRIMVDLECIIQSRDKRPILKVNSRLGFVHAEGAWKLPS